MTNSLSFFLLFDSLHNNEKRFYILAMSSSSSTAVAPVKRECPVTLGYTMGTLSKRQLDCPIYFEATYFRSLYLTFDELRGFRFPSNGRVREHFCYTTVEIIGKT